MGSPDRPSTDATPDMMHGLPLLLLALSSATSATTFRSPASVNLFQSRKIAVATLREEMTDGNDCIAYATCMAGTAGDEQPATEEDPAPWTLALKQHFLPLLTKWAEKFEELTGIADIIDVGQGIIDGVKNWYNNKDEDAKVINRLLAAHEVGARTRDRGMCRALFKCPDETLDELEGKNIVPRVTDIPDSRFSLCPPPGASLCPIFWLSCYFDGIVGVGIPGAACVTATLYCSTIPYACAPAAPTTVAPTVAPTTAPTTAAPTTAAPITAAPTTAAPITTPAAAPATDANLRRRLNRFRPK